MDSKPLQDGRVRASSGNDSPALGDLKRIRNIASRLTDADLSALSAVVGHTGHSPGFPQRAAATLSRSYDHRRAGKLTKVLRRLTEAEIFWIVENPDQTRKPK